MSLPFMMVYVALLITGMVLFPRARKFAVAVFMLFICGVVYAEENVAQIDMVLKEAEFVFKAVLKISKEYKSMGLLGIFSTVSVVIVRVITSKKLLGKWFDKRHPITKRILTGIFICVGTTTATMAIPGGDWISASYAGIFTSGGAMILYDTWKDYKKAKEGKTYLEMKVGQKDDNDLE